MKKTIFSLIAASLVILSACGHKDKSETSSETETVTFEESNPDNDESSPTFSKPDNPLYNGEDADEENYYSAESEQIESDEESLGQKTKNLYHAAKDKYKEKREEWRDEHEDEIEERREKKQELKEKGRELKNKTKEKVGGWLDRTRERLED